MAKKIVSKKASKETTKAAPVAEPKMAEVITHPAVEVQAEAEVATIREEVRKQTPFKETQLERDERLIAAVIKGTMSEALPALVAAMRGTQGTSKSEGTDLAEAKIKRWQVCNDCRQKAPKVVPCAAEGHTKMVVYPSNPRFGPWFPGCIINGVRYLSSNRREKILVPTACVSQIMKQIQDFEENEFATIMGGRTAEHNSGVINEVGESKQNTATSAWR